MHLSPGTVFANDYEVVRELSMGGMGTVYVVQQRSTGKPRALKLMLPQLVSDPSLRKRFEQEARVASLIESDHVVEVVGAGVDEASGAPWLAMELLRGGELSPRVIAESGAPLATMRTILRQICHAVGAAHAAGIVHRDLKPENVFLAESKRAGEQRTVKVLDFGIAKIAAEASTQNTAAMGSPIWMSPEQTEKGAITPAADVWAIGLIVYFLLTGKHFWRSAEADGTIHQVMREVLFDPIPPASERAAEQGVAAALPPWFDRWFAQTVTRDPTQRYRDATELFASFESLAGAMTSMPVPAMPIASVPPSSPRVITPSATASASPSAPTQLLVNTAPAVAIAEPAALPPKRSRRRSIVGVGLMLFVLFIAVARVNKLFSGHRVSASNKVSTPIATPDPPPLATANPPPDSSGEASPGPSPSPSALASGSKPHRVRHPPPGASSALVASAPPPELSAALEEAGKTRPPPPPNPNDGDFDRAAAQERIKKVDLEPCSGLGAQGKGAVTVIFDTNGSVRDVIVETESMKNTPAAKCIEHRLRGARVSSFTGSSKSVMRGFFLH